MSQEIVHYFDIQGMTCSSCVNTIVNVLFADIKEISKVDIELAIGRARVELNKKINPNAIVSAIKDLGFEATYIPESKRKTYRFSLKGLKSNAEAVEITNALEADNTVVESCQLNFSTRSLTITTCPNSSKQERIINRIKCTIRNAVKGKKIEAELNATPIDGRFKLDNSSYYYHKAFVNFLIAAPYILFGTMIPLPVTVMGQFIGLALGGATLGVMLTTGKEFFSDAWREFKDRRRFNMNTLIALGTGSAFFFSMIQVVFPFMFPAAALGYQFLAIFLIFGIVNLGKGVRGVALEHTKKEILSLEEVFLKLQPPVARRVKHASVNKKFSTLVEEDIEEISYLDIQKGDLIEIPSDSRCPVEGTIISEKQIRVKQDTLTGEATPKDMKKGDILFCGSLNMSGVAYIQAMRHGKDSYLTKEVNDVARSLKVKPSISKLIDRIAVYFVPGIIAVAGISALGWFFFGPVPALPWIMKSVMSIFLCTCPCMLTLATPIAETVSNYAMVNNGIFVRDPSVIDDLAELDTIVFDKTGTLTMPTVLNMHANTKDFTEDDILQYVVSLENACIKLGHDHPIARSFLHKQTGFELLKCKNPKKDDQGVSGSVNGHDVLIGCHTHLSTRRVTNLRAFAAEEKKYAKQGLTTIYVAIDGKCVAVYGLKHEIQYGAREAIDKLKRMGINVFMLTGDKDKPSKSVAKDLGINQVMAERNSKEKEMFIRGLERSRKVAMVGDGVNDFAAIRKAHVGIAVGPWTPASSASHIAVHNLDLIPLILIARQTMRNIKQNLWWTGLYNSFSIAAASGVLYPMFGFVMSPVLASILMMTSSLIVVLNSSRLIHEIQYSLDKYHGRINKPRTYWQKFVDFFAVTGLVKTIGMLLGFKQPRPQQYKLNAPDAKFIKDKVKTESPEKPKLREAALPFDIPKGMMLRREPASVVLDDEQSNSLRI